MLALGVAALACSVLAATERRRRRSVSLAVHELRGSLSLIRLHLGTAADRGPTPGVRLVGAGLDLEMDRAVRALDMLDSLRSRRDRTPTACRSVDLDRLVELAAASRRTEADLRRRALVVDVTSCATVTGDRARLAQAVSNLIANAFDHGRGRVMISTVTESSHVRVVVSNGSPAHQAERRSLRLFRGRRCGLAIVRDAARAHGGTLEVEAGPLEWRSVLTLPAAGRSESCRTGRVDFSASRRWLRAEQAGEGAFLPDVSGGVAVFGGTP